MKLETSLIKNMFIYLSNSLIIECHQFCNSWFDFLTSWKTYTHIQKIIDFNFHAMDLVVSHQNRQLQCTKVKILQQTIEFIRKQQWRYIWRFFPNISGFTQTQYKKFYYPSHFWSSHNFDQSVTFMTFVSMVMYSQSILTSL